MGDAGKTLVKFKPDEFKVVAVNAVSNEQTLPLVEIYRNPSGESDLAKHTSVTVKVDRNVLNAYNDLLLEEWVDDGGDTVSFVPFELPTNLLSIIPAPSAADSTFVVEFKAGEFAKSIMVKIPNALNFDFLKKYAIPLKIISVSGVGEKSKAVKDWVVVQVMVKNKWDRLYEVTELSPLKDVGNPTIAGFYPFKYLLVTAGSNSCVAYETPYLGEPYHPISISGSFGYYAEFGLVLEFDEDGNITKLTNYWGQPSPNRRRSAELDPSGVNKWDPVTGNIEIKYYMLQAGSIRTYFHERWIYKGDRP